jgi:N-carbamoyl-L-amino-acid hydrolase
VVEGIVGITWSEVTIVGRADHAGPSPMESRHDALAAAARVITAVEALARRTPDTVATVGRIAVEPNVINTIPGRVVMSVDFRHRDPATLDALVAALERELAVIAGERGVAITLDRFWTSEPTPFDRAVVGAVQTACDELRIPSLRLWSGAGHDAKYLAELCPAAMIFVRSIGGLSHCEEEFSTPEDLEAGANVLLCAAARLAG